jgi:hypothetical protein
MCVQLFIYWFAPVLRLARRGGAAAARNAKIKTNSKARENSNVQKLLQIKKKLNFIV